MVHMVLVLDLNTQTKSGFCRPDGDTTNETLKLTEVIFGDKKLLEIIYLRLKQLVQLISEFTLLIVVSRSCPKVTLA